MPISHFIREVLDILDFNITFYENQSEKQIGNYKKERIKDEICHVFDGVLSYVPDCCEKCGIVNDHTIIKWGFKTVMTQLNKVSEYKTYLRLKKQRFKCKGCHQTFVASSTLTKPNCSIAQRVKLKIATMLEDSVSMTYIAKQMAVAPMTVLRVLRDFYQPTLPEKQALPTVLCLDEFKSGAFAEGAMSCILMDGEHTKLFDVLEDRKKDRLEDYFYRYSLEERQGVKFVVSDFYSPYLSLTDDVFPKAQVVIDRFHIVQLIGKSFQNQRITAMKSFPNTDKRYKQLKKYWKLLQKKQSELDWCHRKWQPSFKDHLTQTEIVDRLLSYDSSLAKGYETYQAFLRVLCYSPDKKKQEERVNEFEKLLSQNYSHLPESYRTTISTFKKYRKEIILALSVPYSNGPVEATNNHIKVIKRMAYGFRNFINFKIRIFINRGKYFRTFPRKGKEKGQATKNAA